MIVLSNVNAQTVPAGGTVIFNTVLKKCGCDTCFRNNSGSVSINGNCALYEVGFGANITGAGTTPVELSINIGGSPLAETEMIYTPAVANAVGHVYTETIVQTCCNLPNNITVTNTGTEPVIISANPVLSINKV